MSKNKPGVGAGTAKGPDPVRTEPMPANLANAPRESRVEPITGAQPVPVQADGPGFIAGMGGPGDAPKPGDPNQPNAAPGLGPHAAAEAVQGSAVQNAPADPAKAALLDTPEGRQAAADAATAANEAARQQALEDQKRIVANAQIEPLSPANVYEGQQTVTMVSPRDFYVLLQDGRRVQFKKGTQEVCEGLAQHSYVKANGCTAYDGKAADKDDKSKRK